MFKEKILREEIKMYQIGNKYRIYGKTFEDREELKNLGAKWNSKSKHLEMSVDDFEKLDYEIKRKVFELRAKQLNASIETISHHLLIGDMKVYLNKDNEYQIYGKTKGIFKELQNVGFKLNNNNYAIKQDDFERLFPNEVKEFVNSYQSQNDYNKQTEETLEEQETQEYEDGELEI